MMKKFGVIFFVAILYWVYSVPIVSNPVTNLIYEPGEDIRYTIPSNLFSSDDGSGIEMTVSSKNDIIDHLVSNFENEGSFAIPNFMNFDLQEEFLYIAAEKSGLWIYNVSDPVNPIFVSQTKLSNAISVTVNGILCVVCEYEYGYSVLDVSNKIEPVIKIESGYMGINVNPTMSYIRSDNITFIAAGDDLYILDLSDMELPVEIKILYDVSVTALTIVGDFLLFTKDDGNEYLCAYQITNLEDPVETYQLDLQYMGTPKGIVVRGNYSYIAYGEGSGGFKTVDVSDMWNLVEINPGSGDESYSIDSSQDGKYVFLGCQDGRLYIYNMTDKTTQTIIKILDPDEDKYYGHIRGVFFDDNNDLLYFTIDGISGIDSGLYIYDLSTTISDPQLKSRILPYPGLDRACDVHVDMMGEVAYVAVETYGLVSFDVKDVSSPYYISSLHLDGVYGIGSKIDDEREIVYLLSNDGGFRTINVSNPKNMTVMGKSESDLVSPESFDFGRKIDSIHTYVYVADYTSGMRILNVTDPYNPTLVETYNPGTLLRTVAVHHSTSSTNKTGSKNSNSTSFAFVGDNSGFFRVIDVEDPNNPFELCSISLLDYDLDFDRIFHVIIEKSGNYATIGGREGFTQLGGIAIIDVTDKYNATFMGGLQTYYSIGILGRSIGVYAIETYSSAYVRILNVTDKWNPQEISVVDSSIVDNQIKGIDLRGNIMYGYVTAQYSGVLTTLKGQIEIYNDPILSFFCGTIEVIIEAKDATGRTEHAFYITRNDSVGTDGCLGNGTCVNNVCVVDICLCNGYGNCSKDNPSTCLCFDGYYGSTCNITTCDGIFSNDTDRVCNGRSTECFPKDVCHCLPGYTSTYCEVSTCFSIFGDEYEDVCSGNGNCADIDQCSCFENYFGVYCNITQCQGHFNNDTNSEYCNGHGKCLDFDLCQCHENYYGVDCSITTCEGIFSNDSANNPNLCNFYGNCTSYDDCVCEKRYFGSNCELTTCNNISSAEIFDVCSGHGDCYDFDQCECDDYTKYDGDFCQLWTCYEIGASNLTTCNGHGLCIDRDKCWCSPGWSSSSPDTYGVCDIWSCGTLEYNDPEAQDVICSGRGECISVNTCDCRDEYDGRNCEKWFCYGIESSSLEACNGQGVCESPDSCQCSASYIGESCQTNSLYFSVMIPILTFVSLTSICILVILSIVICGCICFVIFCLCLCSFFLIGVVLRQFMGLKKFSKLRNFDVLLKEQELEDDDTIAHLRFRKELFEVNMDEIKNVSVLGQGGSQSVVYKSIWNGQTIAFKCFKTRTIATSQDSFDEFEREVELLSSLSHPNIIRFFGACVKSPRVGILMEFCSNGEILQFILKFRIVCDDEYPLPQKIRLLTEVCSALMYLHSRNIIHRDLKCENVLVSGEDEVAKLMDFGLSRFVDKISSPKTKRIGTSEYMAPEVMMGTYDEKVDVFSFGIMFFCVLSEKTRPYSDITDDGDFSNIELRVANDPKFRPDIQNNLKHLPKDLGWVSELIVKCWDHDPLNRNTCKEIREILERKGSVDKIYSQNEETEEDEEEKEKNSKKFDEIFGGDNINNKKKISYDEDHRKEKDYEKNEESDLKMRLKELEKKHKVMIRENEEMKKEIKELKKQNEFTNF